MWTHESLTKITVLVVIKIINFFFESFNIQFSFKSYHESALNKFQKTNVFSHGKTFDRKTISWYYNIRRKHIIILALSIVYPANVSPVKFALRDLRYYILLLWYTGKYFGNNNNNNNDDDARWRRFGIIQFAIIS